MGREDWKQIQDWLRGQKDQRDRDRAELDRYVRNFLAAREAEKEAERMKTQAYLMGLESRLQSAINSIHTPVVDAYLDSLGIRHNDTDPR